MEIGVPGPLYLGVVLKKSITQIFSRHMRIFLPLRVHQNVQKVSVLFIIQIIYMDDTVR